ncbi:MAG TPA: efflux RND transporter periplasmic adaptor subunit [Terriglobales bacterium]|jgi:HlyD family secretion protein|nr:efflux RND transporter periplasmic adaptor subunit [Terriglobales bacterium]
MAAASENGHQDVNGKRTWLVIIGIVVAVVILAAFVSLHRSQVPIRIGHAARETITASIATNGKIEALDNFQAFAPMPTTVKNIRVVQGDWVKAGQMLVRLDDADARMQAARAQAQLKGAEADLNAVQGGGTREEILTTRNALVKAEADRDAAARNLQALQRLLQSGAASQAEVNAAQSKLNVADSEVHVLDQKLKDRFSQQVIGHVQAQEAEARASLQAARDTLKNTNVTAPHEGMVYSLPVRDGAFVNTGDLLVQVADLHKVRVRAFVDEPEIGRLRQGQAVEVTWDALPGRVWRGTLETLPTTVVPHGTRMVGEVTCVIQNEDLKLLPNTNVNVAVITAREENVVTVPREAIHQDANGQYVFQVVDGELRRRNVKTSVSDLTRVEVTSGLSDDAVLALGALNMQSLKGGMAVKPANP